MRIAGGWLALAVALGSGPAQAQESGAAGPAEQVEQAVLAAPSALRDGATVLGYGGAARDGDPLSLLRPGSGELVCLADDPAVEGFHVACYHESLEPYMVLGRRVRAAGGDRRAVMDARYSALESGELSMPARAALYSLSSDAAPGEAGGARRLVVVYVPGATPGELGLPGAPDGDTPWLMLPGTPWAHIMISR